MDENNSKPRVEYSEFRRMLEEMRGNKQNSAQDSDNELTNNIKDLVVVVKELTKNITMIIGGQRTAPMGATPFTAALQNNNPKIQSDEDQLEAIKREDEQTELLRIIAKNTGYREKAKPEKDEEFNGGLLSKIALAGVAVAGLFYGYFQTWFKVVKGLFNGITKVLKGAYELLIPETLRKNISESFSRIGTFFSELGNKAKALFVFEEGSAIGKAITAVKNGFSSIGGVLGKIGEGIGGAVKAISKIPGIVAFLKIAGTTFAFATGVGEIVAIAITIYDTINGAIEGWKKGGFIGAITGALQGLIGGFVGGFADFIKWVSSGLLGMLGFKDAEKWLDSFSFTKIINDFIEAVASPFQMIQDMIMHPIDSLKKLGGVISDVFTKITKVFDPVIEFFSGIGKSVIGMLEGIGIPEIGFTIPIIGKKVSIGPFYPFKSDAKKPVAPAETPAAKTAPEAADTTAKMPAGQVANVDAGKSEYRISLEKEYELRAKAANGYALNAGNGQNPDGTANKGMIAFMDNEARMRELDGLIEKDNNARKAGKPTVPEVSKNKAPEKVAPSVVPPSPAVATPIKASPIVEAKTPAVATPIKASPIVEAKTPAVATPVSAEPKVVFRRSTMTSETIGGQVITGYERGYQLHGKKEDVDQADNAYAAFRKASSNGDDAGAQAAAEEFIRLATMIKSPEYVAKMKEISAKQSGRAQAVATPTVNGEVIQKGETAVRGGQNDLPADDPAAIRYRLQQEKIAALKVKAPIVEKAATPIPGGGQITDANAQNYNANYAEFRREMDGETPQAKAPEKASPIVEGKKVGPNWLEAQRRYAREDSSTPADHLSGQFPGIQAKFRELVSKAKPLTDSYQSIERLEQNLVTQAMRELKDKQTVTPEMQAMRKASDRSAALTQAASTGNTIEAKTSDVANSRDALTTSGNGGSAIVNAPTTVNNTNQNTTVAKSPFRNEEGTINKYYSTRLGAY